MRPRVREPRIRRLETELRKTLNSTAGKEWTRDLLTTNALARLRSLTDIEAHFASEDQGLGRFETRDAILRELLRRCRGEHGARFGHALMLLLYAPLLDRAARRAHFGALRDHEDMDEVIAVVVHRFIDLTARLNLERNRDIHTSLVRRLPGAINDWAARERARSYPPASAFNQDGSLASLEPRKCNSDGWELDAAELALFELQQRGVISIETRALLVANVVDRRSLIALAAPANSNQPVDRAIANDNVAPASYEATKKRAQRGRARIRAHVLKTGEQLSEIVARAAKKKEEVRVSPRGGCPGEEERDRGVTLPPPKKGPSRE